MLSKKFYLLVAVASCPADSVLTFPSDGDVQDKSANHNNHKNDFPADRD